MARARNIKPAFFTNDHLADVHPLGRLLFIGLWTVADREGRLEDRPRRIKAEVLPYDDVDCDTLLNQLAEHGFILRYSVDSKRFIQVLKFNKHQNPHMKEAASVIPAPDSTGTSTVQVPDLTGSSPADTLNPLTDTLNPLTDTLSPEKNIAEPTAQAHVSKSTKSPDDLFETFWQAYPKAVAGRSIKQQSKTKFKAALKKDSFENIMAGLEWWKKTDKWKSDGGKYVDGAQKWLHNEFWREVAEPEQGRDISPSNQKQPEPATDVDWGPDPNLAWMLDPSLPKPWEKDNG